MKKIAKSSEIKQKSERARAVESAISNGRMPRYAITDQIRFEESQGYPKLPYEQLLEEEFGRTPSPFGRIVYVPFSRAPIDAEVQAVATNLAKFISEYSGTPCGAKKISTRGYRIVPTAELEDILAEGYSVAEGLIPHGQYRLQKGVEIYRETKRHRFPGVMQAYVKSFRK